MVLTVTPQARAISAVSAPASRIALARAILGSLMSGVSALMPSTVRGEGGVGDRSSSRTETPALSRGLPPRVALNPEGSPDSRCARPGLQNGGIKPSPPRSSGLTRGPSRAAAWASPGSSPGQAPHHSTRHPGLDPGSGAGISAIRTECVRQIPARCASGMTERRDWRGAGGAPSRHRRARSRRSLPPPPASPWPGRSSDP
jgi:hypothetical protein